MYCTYSVFSNEQHTDRPLVIAHSMLQTPILNQRKSKQYVYFYRATEQQVLYSLLTTQKYSHCTHQSPHRSTVIVLTTQK